MVEKNKIKTMFSEMRIAVYSLEFYLKGIMQ